ncbi:MAG: sugar phosphate isomerase/epimerase family protein [Planctomycetia bacterium]|nr:sugar phosphate isomerase/epimerase family protein [Planctomycetia bacterium]
MNRRNFCKSAVLAAAAVGMNSVAWSAQTGSAMKFALCNEMFVGWSLEKQFRFMGECGYQGAELAPYALTADLGHGNPETFDLSSLGGTQTYDKINKLATAAGIQVAGLHCLLTRTKGYHLNSPDPDVRKKTVAYFCELARFCRMAGGSYMVLGSPNQRKLLPGVSMVDAYDLAAKTLEQIMPTLEKLDVTLAFEALAPNENEFIQTGRDALFLIEKMGKPSHLAIHLDCKAMFASEKEPIPTVLRDAALRPYMKTFHANDANLQGPGFGKLDFAPIMAALKEIKFDGWVGVEPLDFTPGPERLGSESLKNLKKYL